MAKQSGTGVLTPGNGTAGEAGTKKERKKRRWLGIVVLIGVLALLAVGIRKGRERMAGAPRWHARPVPVSVLPVNRSVLRKTLHYVARLESVSTAEVAARITARVETIRVDEGYKVQQGELLARLDDRDIRSQIQALRARIRSQKARLKGNRAALDAARDNVIFLKREYDRDRRLFKEKGISASELDASRNQLDLATGKVRSLEEECRSIEAELKALQAQVNEARTRRTYTEIRAPFKGVIQRRYVDVGDLAKPGMPLFRIMDRSAHRLAFDLVQEDLAQVRPGQKVVIHWPVPVAPRLREGVVSRIFPALESGKTVRVEVDLSCTCSATLKVGSFIPVDVVVLEERGLTVPREALIPLPGKGSAVYAVRKGALTLVPVKIRILGERRALVEGAVQEGDRVAVGEYLQWVRRSLGERVEVKP